MKLVVQLASTFARAVVRSLGGRAARRFFLVAAVCAASITVTFARHETALADSLPDLDGVSCNSAIGSGVLPYSVIAGTDIWGETKCFVKAGNSGSAADVMVQAIGSGTAQGGTPFISTHREGLSYFSSFCPGDQPQDNVSIQHGKLTSANNTEYAANTPGFSDDFVLIAWSCEVIQTSSSPVDTIQFRGVLGPGGSGTAGSFDIATNADVDYRCSTLGGFQGGDFICATSDLALASPAPFEWTQEYPDDFGTPFSASICSTLPTPTYSGPAVIAGGDTGTWTLTAAEADPTLVDMSVRFLDQPTATNFAESSTEMTASLTRNVVLASVSSAAVEFVCTDQYGEVYAQPGTPWGPTPAVAQACAGVTVTSQLTGTLVGGAPYTFAIDVDNPNVVKVQYRTPNGGGIAISNGGGVTLSVGAHSVTAVLDSNDFDLSSGSVICTGSAGFPVTIYEGDGYYVGNPGAVFQRPEGEAAVSECFEFDGVGINPVEWLPALVDSLLCLSARLFLPGDYVAANYEAKVADTTFGAFAEPFEIMVAGFGSLGDSEATCSSTWDMPDGIPDIEINQCEGGISQMRSLSFTMSTFLIAIWGYRVVAERLEQSIGNPS